VHGVFDDVEVVDHVAQSYGRLLHDVFENLSVSSAQMCNKGAAMARGDEDVASVAAPLTLILFWWCGCLAVCTSGFRAASLILPIMMLRSSAMLDYDAFVGQSIQGVIDQSFSSRPSSADVPSRFVCL